MNHYRITYKSYFNNTLEYMTIYARDITDAMRKFTKKCPCYSLVNCKEI